MSSVIKKLIDESGNRFLIRILFIALIGMGVVSKCAANSFAVDELVDQWITIEAQRENLILDWAEQKQSILQQVSILEAENQALAKVAENNRLRIDQNREERLQLAQTQGDLEKEQKKMETAVEAAALKLLSLQTRVPPPLQKSWEIDAEELSNPEISTSDRLDYVLRLLKHFDSFNKRIVVNESVIDIPGKGGLTPVLVTQVYMGVSQGWFASDDGKYYGFGKPVNGKWHWFFQNEADQYLGEALNTKSILDVANMVENPATAKLVQLPISISPEE